MLAARGRISMSFDVTILGCSSATPTVDRHPSAQVLNVRDTLMLLDCGEATQNQLLHYRISHHRIRYIFISHLHGDHFLGLHGLLATINFQGRQDELTLFGPPDLEAMIMDYFKFSGTYLKFPLKFVVTQDQREEKILETNYFEVYSIPLRHRIPTTGFLIREKEGLRHINAARCEELNIPFAHYKDLKEGKDYTDENGKQHPNAELTFPPDQVRSYAYISDTRFTPELKSTLSGVNLLYHESTFLHELLERAEETFHTTALEAGQMAAMCGAGKLLLGHFSARYRDLTPLLEEAKSAFENVHLAIEGVRFTVD